MADGQNNALKNQNMKTINIIACALVAMLASCAEKDTWSPGPKSDPSSPKVYFESSDGEVEPGGESLDMAVSRKNTSGALTVPIKVVSAAPELSFPDAGVTFAPGEETAYYKVNFSSDSKYETDYPFELKIDEAFTDQYIIEAPGFAGKLRRLEPWVFIAEMDCTYEGRSGTNKPDYGPWKQKLYKKEIAGLFKIEDWCLNGTGEWYGDLIFTVDENKQLLPDPSVGFHMTADKRWYFYTPDATSDASKFQINGHLPTETGIYMTYFYLYTVGSTDARYSMTFDEEAKTARLGGYSRFSSSAFSSGAFYLHYKW
jgi:hypothetical protein